MSPTLFHECLFHLLSVLVGTAASWRSSLTSCYYIISIHHCSSNSIFKWSCLDSEGELDTDIDVTGHLDDLGQLDSLLGGGL